MNAQMNSKLETRNSELATSHAPPQLTALPAPKARPRSRNGKIARLPYPERDMVNRMLWNNIAYAKIVGALDEHQNSVNCHFSAQSHRKLNSFFFGEMQPEPTLGTIGHLWSSSVDLFQ